MKMRHLILLNILWLCSLFSFAQQDVPFDKNYFPDDPAGFKEANGFFKEGNYQFESQLYSEALEQYLKAHEFNPDNAQLNYNIGICYLNLIERYKCKTYFEKAYQLNNFLTPDIHYMMARGYHLNSEFDLAVKEYKNRLAGLKPTETAEWKPQIEKRIKECEAGKKMIENPARAFIDNLGTSINSEFNDHSPLITADEGMMFFTSTRNNGRTLMENGQYDEDIYVSYRLNNTWDLPIVIGEPINTQFDDATVGLTPDGQKLLIYNGKRANGDIESCWLKGTDWDYPEALPKPINSDAHESSACYSSDGLRLYFVSDRPGGFGGKDIYVCHKNSNGKWNEPVNLGPNINSEADEETAYLHPDGRTLYFSSEGHVGMGGYDIFVSYLDESEKWSVPQNMGFPINSPDDDFCFVISANGRHGYCSSVRPDGTGGYDIYRMTFLGPEKPLFLSTEDNLLSARTNPISDLVAEASVELKTIRLTIVKGIVTDAISQQPIAAQIDITDNDKNEVIFTSQTNSASGKFLVSLPSGKNYGLAVKAENYLFHSENFDIPAATEYQEIAKDITLNNVKKDVKIILKNVFFETGSATLKPASYAELGRLAKLLTDLPQMRIEISGHTDNQGSKAANQKLSQGRAKSVVDFLVSEGIPAERLEYKGYAFDQPIADNATKDGRAQNRRVEFKVLSTE